MNEVLLKINQAIPAKIFDTPRIKERIDSLFSTADDSIKKRFDEIKTFITREKNDEYSQIQYDTILVLFRMYFCKSILNKAIEITFTEDGRYNVENNIFEILSEKNLNDAVSGEPMINAFAMAIRDLPSYIDWGDCIHESTILLLKKKFLGISIFS